MSEEMLNELNILNELDIDRFRKVLSKYTTEAFQKLPKLDKPRMNF